MGPSSQQSELKMSKITIDINDLKTSVMTLPTGGQPVLSIKNGKDHIVIVGLPKLALEKIERTLRSLK